MNELLFEKTTVGRLIFEGKKFRGFHGQSLSLKNKYPHNF